jgi:hypothetical protein
VALFVTASPFCYRRVRRSRLAVRRRRTDRNHFPDSLDGLGDGLQKTCFMFSILGSCKWAGLRIRLFIGAVTRRSCEYSERIAINCRRISRRSGGGSKSIFFFIRCFSAILSHQTKILIDRHRPQKRVGAMSCTTILLAWRGTAAKLAC